MGSRIAVHDRMQHNYRYELTEPEGKHFDPSFAPDLSPEDMLSLGVFGGVYMRDCVKEFPKHWFAHAKFATGERDPKLNYFGVDASQSLASATSTPSMGVRQSKIVNILVFEQYFRTRLVCIGIVFVRC